MDDENSLDLFESVLGGLTEKQWEEYKQQKKLKEGVLVLDSSSSEGEDECMAEESTSPSVTQFEIVHGNDRENMVYSEEDEDSPEGSSPKTMISWDSNAALRYVNGEISFSQLAEIMENSRKLSITDGDKGLDEQQMDVDCAQSSTPKKKKRIRRRAYELPKELEGLMGTANMCFANGEAEKALNTCMELIRQAPNSQQPYQTLAMIYEEQGDMKKYLQCCLLAAYLNPSDTEEWIRLAGLSQEQGSIQQAIRCYSSAIRNEPTNIAYLWERCNLYELLGDRKNALAGYELILQNLSSPDDGEKCVEISREIAKVHHENEDLVNAIKVLESAFSKFPNLITSEDVNLLLELQVTQKYYRAALKTYVLHCGVTLHLADKVIKSSEEVDSCLDDHLQEIKKCDVPDVLPIDIQVKLLICIIHLKALKAAEELVPRLKQESPDVVGDLYLDVAEAFLEANEPLHAEPLLIDLIASEKYNLAAVWLKYGDCLNMLLRGNEATEAYNTVLQMAPSYQEARISLAKILLDSGNKLEAANVLKQEYEEGKEDAVTDLGVLFQRCEYLYELEYFEDFIKAAIVAQYSHCYKLETDEEYKVVVQVQQYRRRVEVLRELPSIVERSKPAFVNTDVPMEKQWELYQKLCQKLFELGRLQELQDVSLIGLTSNLWRKSPTMTKDAEFLALLSCFYNKSHAFAYTLLRDAILKDLGNHRLWNIFCLNVMSSQQARHHRFCLRLSFKNIDNFALGLLNGHTAMNSGSYKHALGEYTNLLRKHPNDPLLLFYVGIIFTHMASQKFATKRYLLVCQAFAFLQKYLEGRNSNQEAFYNIGRALHQLGIKDGAVVYYKKALEAPPAIQGQEGEENVFDLKCEIAYNLSLIYQGSGSHDLAALYLRTYNVV